MPTGTSCPTIERYIVRREIVVLIIFMEGLCQQIAASHYRLLCHVNASWLRYYKVAFSMGCKVSSAVVVAPDKELSDYLTQGDIALVRDSWTFLADDMSASGLVIFRRLLESGPQLSRLFERMMVRLSDGQTAVDDGKLERHALIVMQGLGAAVESLHDSVYLTNILIIMGRRHRDYGLKPYMFQYLWEAIEHGLRTVLGETLDHHTHQAWKRVFDYIASKMTEGLLTDGVTSQQELTSENSVPEKAPTGRRSRSHSEQPSSDGTPDVVRADWS